MRLLRLAALACIAVTVLGLTSCTRSSAPGGDTGSYSPPAPPPSSSTAAPVIAAFTHQSTVNNVLDAAKSALTKLGYYAYGTYDKDIAAAAEDLSTSYAARFNATAKSQKEIALKLHSVSRVTGMTLGIASLGIDLESATVVAGFTQTVTGNSSPHRRVSKVAAVVGMVEVNQKWLVNSLAIPPVGPATAGTYSLGSDDLTAAMAAGVTTVTTVGSLRRKDIAADYAKWLAITTGALHDRLAKAQKSTESAFKNARADLTTVCKAAGVISTSSTKVELLVYVTASGSLSSSTLSELTMEKVKGHWLGEQIKTL